MMSHTTIRTVNSRLWAMLGAATIVCILGLPTGGFANEISELRQALDQMKKRT
jgi:hypothetical protein